MIHFNLLRAGLPKIPLYEERQSTMINSVWISAHLGFELRMKRM